MTEPIKLPPLPEPPFKAWMTNADAKTYGEECARVALQSKDREDAARWRYAMDWGTKGFAVCQRVDGIGECWEPIKTNGPIDHARRIEGEGE